MVAGEVNKQFQVEADLDLTAYTVTLTVKHASESVARSISMTGGVNVATRTTQATDFPYPGTYEIQVKATNGTTTLYSDIFTISVGQVLT